MAVLDVGRIGVRRGLHQGRVEDIAPGGDEQAFGEAALAPFLRQLDQARGLERAQVVAEVLARQAQLLRQAGGGGRLGQGGENTPTDGGQRQQGGVQVVEQG